MTGAPRSLAPETHGPFALFEVEERLFYFGGEQDRQGNLTIYNCSFHLFCSLRISRRVALIFGLAFTVYL